MLILSKSVNPTIMLPKTFLILLPLSRENVSSFLSPILGLYSIKPKDFLEKFIEQFNQLTKNKYDTEFDDFLSDEVSHLCTLNMIIPIKVHIINFEKLDYNLILLQSSVCILRQFNFLSMMSHSDSFNVTLKKKFYQHLIIFFLYNTAQFLFSNPNCNIYFNLFPTRLQILLYMDLRYVLLIRLKSIIRNWKYLKKRRKLRKFLRSSSRVMLNLNINPIFQQFTTTYVQKYFIY